VGGGIHFGEVAKVDAKVDLRSYALVYTKKEGLYFRNGKDGSKITISADISPEAMKALFCFAASGRNAAISIGWAQRPPEGAAKVTRNEGNSSPVLLDPFLVDTPVGRDLVVADSIPWKLDQERLPNDKAIPFHKEFKAGVAQYQKEQIDVLLPLFEQAKPLTADTRSSWAERLESADVPLVRALVAKDKLDDAKEWYIAQQIKAELKRAKVTTSAEGNPRLELKNFLKARALKKATSIRRTISPTNQRCV
jgi:hypothetical protein